MFLFSVDVYIVGTANTGKSSLFNTLLASDYCKSSARTLIERATVSMWPEDVYVTDTRKVFTKDFDEKGEPWGQEIASYTSRDDGSLEYQNSQLVPETYDADKYDQSYWTFDTPGAINPDQGDSGIFLAVHSGPNIPIHVVPTSEADQFYETHIGTEVLGNVLSQVKSAINEQRPKVSTSRTLLLHDNAGPHKARATTQSLREQGI
ncbi:nitric oxide-associated protein 1 [Elysia marginata]|uniref:Nitric oxide-associated protein 1 n=1 Tax=Elysia marginata TaxID=1093978 RepID=A0AAV4JXY1_9GAST|nr:nitric oxide-associated protein 1 [Elysia marginata]